MAAQAAAPRGPFGEWIFHIVPWVGLCPASLLAGALVLAGTPLLARAASDPSLPGPGFATVSIAADHSPNFPTGFSSLPESLTIVNLTLKDIVAAAYGVHDIQVVGGAGWTGSDRFDITALVSDSEAEQLENLTPEERQEQRRLSLQRLLADRFNLKVSFGAEKVPMYALVAAQGGPTLQRTGPWGTLGIGTLGLSGAELTGEGIPMSSAQDMSLVRMLEQVLGRMVIDRTGLQGDYNFTLQWRRNQNPSSTFERQDNYPQSGMLLLPDSAGSSIFTALRDQLGLELRPMVGTVPTVVIHHVENPS